MLFYSCDFLVNKGISFDKVSQQCCKWAQLNIFLLYSFGIGRCFCLIFWKRKRRVHRRFYVSWGFFGCFHLRLWFIFLFDINAFLAKFISLPIYSYIIDYTWYCQVQVQASFPANPHRYKIYASLISSVLLHYLNFSLLHLLQSDLDLAT